MRNAITGRAVAFLSLCAALAMSGCGDDPVGLEGDALSDAELQAVLNALTGTFSSISASPAAAASGGPALASTSVDQSFETSVACPQGGAIGASGSLSGTVDDETFASDLRFELTFAPDGCVVTTPETSITVDGDPNIEIVVNSLFNETVVSMSGTQQGRIRYTVDDGRSGACSMDITFSTTIDRTSTNSVEQSVTGSVCGVSASEFQVFAGG